MKIISACLPVIIMVKLLCTEFLNNLGHALDMITQYIELKIAFWYYVKKIKLRNFLKVC